MKTRCTATTQAGRPCQAWAVEGTQPPRCSAHGGGRASVGAPDGNANAVTHGFYQRPARPLQTIQDAIEHLAASLQRLDAYINQHIDALDASEIARLIQVHGMNLSRLARMLKDQATLDGPAGTLDSAIDEALQILEQEGFL
jgi:hypothetical protein